MDDRWGDTPLAGPRPEINPTPKFRERDRCRQKNSLCAPSRQVRSTLACRRAVSAARDAVPLAAKNLTGDSSRYALRGLHQWRLREYIPPWCERRSVNDPGCPSAWRFSILLRAARASEILRPTTSAASARKRVCSSPWRPVRWARACDPRWLRPRRRCLSGDRASRGNPDSAWLSANVRSSTESFRRGAFEL